MSNTKNPVSEDEVVAEVVKPAKKVNKPKHDPSELIVCRSVRFGELRLIGPKTHMPYSWANEGDFREVEYQDLVSWRALHSKYLFAPMIIIEDEEICEEWKADLGKLYEEVQEDEKVEEACTEELTEAAEDEAVEDEIPVEEVPAEEPIIEDEPRQVICECDKCGALVIKDEADIIVDEEQKKVTVTLPEATIQSYEVNAGTMDYIFVKDKYESIIPSLCFCVDATMDLKTPFRMVLKDLLLSQNTFSNHPE